jgi:hypothetical protein
LIQNSRGANKKRDSHPSNRNASEVKTSVLKSMLKEQKQMKATIASLETQAAMNELESDENNMVMIPILMDQPRKRLRTTS